MLSLLIDLWCCKIVQLVINIKDTHLIECKIIGSFKTTQCFNDGISRRPFHSGRKFQQDIKFFELLSSNQKLSLGCSLLE